MKLSFNGRLFRDTLLIMVSEIRNLTASRGGVDAKKFAFSSSVLLRFFILMSTFNDISCEKKDGKRMRIECSFRFSVCEWIWNRTMVICRFGFIQSSMLRVHCQEVDSEAKAMEICRFIIVLIWSSIQTVFWTIISVNQFSLCGTIAEMCEEYETFHDRTGQPFVGGQLNSSFVPSVIKTEVPLDWMTLLAKILYCNHTENELKKRQIEQILYGCRIPEFCRNRTVLHDERYCRIFTIHRCSGLLWVHSAKRRRSICTKRLDTREHQNWTRIGSHNHLLAR